MPSPTSTFAVASCCLVLSSAFFQLDTVNSFVAPRSQVARTSCCRQHDNTLPKSSSSSLNVRISPPWSSTNSNNTTETSNKVVDDVWTKQSSSAPSPITDKDMQNFDIGLTFQNDVTEEGVTADSTKLILIGGTAFILAAAAALAVSMGNDLGIDLELGQLIKDPSSSFDMILSSLETMDPQKGMIYFSSFYVLAEILAIPAVPLLTASSGYLFGTLPGTATCLFSAAIAASISFVIGRTLLRGYVENVLADNPKFASMDRAIEKEGFKLMLLLRLSPLFPFALSNYLYGASSIQFLPYFFGTLLGFAPGTFAYVYAGRIGKALTIDSATSEPWYVYVGGMAVVVSLLKIAGDVASGVIDAMEEEDDAGWDGGDMDIS
mmetsp:Transcript_24742/g.52483  ORF Transcript_24742/g.52483 Transcript_24742/m.52483 type:complete len:378 (+) Transcript_24742:246-1379(+)|eukprot:CAMPEP_0183731542 /NCGR_PEP_ID=MMETSP0737-20130205/35698_1 /TAXON_ID=385413 /ORGANISM="Thalassiosira miniscula, Strain CCMP1093" /LENGTH=377 /DNA_ID=CAMNT_0025964291 /DNA_START=201 /DNA_END=1334 /DNA_ORIENTATION=+